MKVLVAGGAGYIGSHCVRQLQKAGHHPIVVDNLAYGHRGAVHEDVPFHKADIGDSETLVEILRREEIEAVMHFAALSQVGESIDKPGLYWENNVQGSLNLIQSAVDHECKNFVFSSTCATYGDQNNVVLDENSAQYPVNPYGASKRAVENMLNDFQEPYGLRSVIFRYFNVAGADPDCEIGEFHQPETHLIPLILDAIDGKRDALTVFGTDYDTPDGTCIRDYVHVCDLVDAHILGLNFLLDGKGSRVFNLGTGDGFSVREVIDHAKQVTKKEVPIIYGQRRPGDCSKLGSGSNRAINELGWTAGRSNLIEMITDAWRWHQNGNYNE